MLKFRRIEFILQSDKDKKGEKMRNFLVILAVLMVSSAVQAKETRLLIVGDSLTAANGSYARQLSKQYDAQIIARTGNTTSWMYRQLVGKDLSRFTHLIVLGGVNDINQGHRPEIYLDKIYRLGKLANLRVVAITMSPWKGWSSWSIWKHHQTMVLNGWITRQLGGPADVVVDFCSFVKNLFDGQSLDLKYGLGTDRLHPNRRAQELLFLKVVESL
jgi:hypothetical protein